MQQLKKKKVRKEREEVKPTHIVLPGYPSQSACTPIALFVSPIFSYFCLFVGAFSPCHGSDPRKKYIKTWPKASRSSRRDCSNKS